MNKGKLLAVGLGLMTFLYSCKDNTGNLGPNVLPNSDLISAYSVDTTTVVTSMYLKDSAITSSLLDILLGSYNDPVFGESKASLYASVSPCNLFTSAPWAAGIADSAVLMIQLDVAPYYGGSDPQVFDVYQTDSAVTSSYNYSSMSVPYHILMGSQLVTPPQNNALNDTLKIKLSNSWVTTFAYNLLNGANWTTGFSNIIKGIYVTTSTPLQLPGQGSLLNVPYLSASFSAIRVYYHVTPGNEGHADFPIGSSDADLVHFDHNYSSTYLGTLHPMGPRDSVGAGQLMYVQGMAGVMGRLNFPNLYKNWSTKGPVIINEAVLTLPYQPQYPPVSSVYTYGPPATLYVYATDSTWGESLIDGQVISSSPSNNSYSFVITQYIQKVIDGKIIDRGLFVLPDEATTANGVVLYGAQHGISNSQKTLLTIYYTPLKKN